MGRATRVVGGRRLTHAGARSRPVGRAGAVGHAGAVGLGRSALHAGLGGGAPPFHAVERLVHRVDQRLTIRAHQRLIDVERELLHGQRGGGGRLLLLLRPDRVGRVEHLAHGAQQGRRLLLRVLRRALLQRARGRPLQSARHLRLREGGPCSRSLPREGTIQRPRGVRVLARHEPRRSRRVEHRFDRSRVLVADLLLERVAKR